MRIIVAQKATVNIYATVKAHWRGRRASGKRKGENSKNPGAKWKGKQKLKESVSITFEPIIIIIFGENLKYLT
jgi:hypothetical protein